MSAKIGKFPDLHILLREIYMGNGKFIVIYQQKAEVLVRTPAFILRTANNLICRGARLKL